MRNKRSGDWILGTLAVLGLAFPLSRATAGDRTEPSAMQVPADNTGKNVRDREENAKTADQQSNDQEDLEITRAVRQAIVKDESLSTSAHNVKIITIDGVVTLRGPVVSKAEKTNIGATATKVAGVSRVDNQLEVAKP